MSTYTHKPPPAITRIWEICGTVPTPVSSEGAVFFNRDFQIVVEAPTMEAAIERARKTFPTSVFTICRCAGDIHLKADDAMSHSP